MNNHSINKHLMPYGEYEGYDYQSYWSGTLRRYEDSVERLAIRKLLPNGSYALIDLGANFGRLANEYHNYERVFLVDGAFSAVKQANQLWSKSNYQTLTCDIQKTPFEMKSFDVVMCIRTIHHQENVAPIIFEANRLLKPNGIFIFTFANKRNLKQRLLSMVGLSRRNINDIQPVAIGENVFNFHPKHIDALLEENGFQKEATLGVGIFRNDFIARRIQTSTLVNTDAFLQPLSGRLNLSPSVLVRARKV